MRTRSGLAALALPVLALPGALLAVTVALAPSAGAAETALVVTGEPSGPGGVSTASCPPGTHLTGGGYEWTPDTEDGRLRYDRPSKDATGWEARADRGSVRAHAVCETED